MWNVWRYESEYSCKVCLWLDVFELSQRGAAPVPVFSVSIHRNRCLGINLGITAWCREAALSETWTHISTRAPVDWSWYISSCWIFHVPEGQWCQSAGPDRNTWNTCYTSIHANCYSSSTTMRLTFMVLNCWMICNEFVLVPPSLLMFLKTSLWNYISYVNDNWQMLDLPPPLHIGLQNQWFSKGHHSPLDSLIVII